MTSPPEDTTTVRVLYSDLHGVARGKDVPAEELERIAERGLCFCAAVMSTDLRHTPVLGGEAGYPDLHAFPDLDTLVSLPWEPGVAACLADLRPAEGGAADRRPARPRPPRRRAVRGAGAAARSSAPSSSSSSLNPDGTRLVDRLSMVYTVGPQVDPGGIVRTLTEQLAAIGMGAFAINHEYMNSQYEINLIHSDALDAADRAFRLKAAVKDVAALQRAGRDVHGQAVQRPGRLGHAPAPLAGARRRERVRHRRRAAEPVRRGHPAPRRRAHGDPEPDDQRLPAPGPGLARADPRRLGARQPRDVHPHPARARLRIARRGPLGRRRREPVPGHRRAAAGRPPGHQGGAGAAAARRGRRLPRRGPRPAAARRRSRRRWTRWRPTTCSPTRSAPRSSPRSWP